MFFPSKPSDTQCRRILGPVVYGGLQLCSMEAHHTCAMHATITKRSSQTGHTVVRHVPRPRMNINMPRFLIGDGSVILAHTQGLTLVAGLSQMLRNHRHIQSAMMLRQTLRMLLHRVYEHHCQLHQTHHHRHQPQHHHKDHFYHQPWWSMAAVLSSRTCTLRGSGSDHLMVSLSCRGQGRPNLWVAMRRSWGR